MKSVIFEEGVTIGYSAFEGCSVLVSLTIPGSVTTIGEWAFNGCSDLAILAPAELMENLQRMSIQDVSLYSRSNPAHVLSFYQLPEVQKYNPFFSNSAFQFSRNLLGRRARAYINTVLLVAARLDSIFFNRFDSGELAAYDANSIQERCLPPEIWIYILGFVQRLDMIVIPNTLANGSQVESRAGVVSANDGVDNVSDSPSQTSTNSCQQYCPIS